MSGPTARDPQPGEAEHRPRWQDAARSDAREVEEALAWFRENPNWVAHMERWRGPMVIKHAAAIVRAALAPASAAAAPRAGADTAPGEHLVNAAAPAMRKLLGRVAAGEWTADDAVDVLLDWPNRAAASPRVSADTEPEYRDVRELRTALTINAAAGHPVNAAALLEMLNAAPAAPPLGYRDGFTDGARYARDIDAATARVEGSDRSDALRAAGDELADALQDLPRRSVTWTAQAECAVRAWRSATQTGGAEQ